MNKEKEKRDNQLKLIILRAELLMRLATEMILAVKEIQEATPELIREASRAQ